MHCFHSTSMLGLHSSMCSPAVNRYASILNEESQSLYDMDSIILMIPVSNSEF